MFKQSALLLSALASAQAADIVVFGDSWGTFGASEFEFLASNMNMTVDNRAVGGTTAAFWARPANQLRLRDAVRENPDAKYLWLTIGGNDAIPKNAAGVPIEQIKEEAIADIKEFMVPLFEDNSEIEVFGFGYEVLNFSTIGCEALGRAVFYQCDFGSEDYTACCNGVLEELQNAYDDVEQVDWTNGQFTSVNLLGSMQAAGGVAGAAVGSPNRDEWTPSQFLTGGACIHANNQGYKVIFDALYQEYFVPRGH